MSTHLRENNKPKLSFGCLKAQAEALNRSRASNKENQTLISNLYSENNIAVANKISFGRKASLKLNLNNSFRSQAKATKSPVDSNNIFQNIIRKESKCVRQQNIVNRFDQRNSVRDKVEQQFIQYQQTIRVFIDQYNHRFSEIMEILTDMQIKDLMKFNKLLQKNQKAYDLWKNTNISPNFVGISNQQSSKIQQLSLYIEKLSEQPMNICYDFRSTVDSKTSKKLNKQSQQQKQQQKHEKKQPSKKQNNKNSLQDTPESVKSRLSEVSNRIKVPNKKIGMFDKINVCESIEQGLVPMSISFKSDQQKQKKVYRYGRVSED